ncbi:hypothetical protein BH24BAC1_BH24BAC1_07230 [soil metagenome]
MKQNINTFIFKKDKMKRSVKSGALVLLNACFMDIVALSFTQCKQGGNASASGGGRAAHGGATFAPGEQDPDGSKAAALVNRVIKEMGGKKAWDSVPYVAWSFAGSYQVWDKHANNYRYEKDSIVAVTNLDTRQGKAYIQGKDVTGTEAGQKIIDRMYAAWANNSYWLLMPWKLADPGLTVRYLGEGQTEAGEPADLLELTFEKVGVTPQNKYIVAVSKEKGLVTQWSFFRNASDPTPSFTRPWHHYQSYGPVKLSTGRSTNTEDGVNIRNLALPSSVPATVFNSPTPIEKL